MLKPKICANEIIDDYRPTAHAIHRLSTMCIIEAQKYHDERPGNERQETRERKEKEDNI